MNTARPAIPAAFVDVDHTLVRDITFLSLFVFDAERRGSGGAAADAIERFHALRASGMSRRRSHRWFYRQLAGLEVAEVQRAGRDWFESEMSAPGFFNLAVRHRLGELAETGTRIVLVSGSFDAALQPLAEAVGAETVLCTELESIQGRYTGEVEQTMVGSDKSAALRRYSADRSIDLSSCAAFGDHHSDIAMFDLVNHPVVVGSTDRELDSYPAARLPG
ncbi:HAD family hydrolase [Nocardia sp. NPDC055053]